jgi:hypothetical protein
MTSRTLRLLAALMASMLLLAACGGDDGDDDATTTTEAEADETTTTEAEADETTTTEATDDTTEDTTEGTTEEGAGSFDLEALAEVDDFCDLDDLGDSMDDTLFSGEPSSPEAMEQAYQAMGAFFVRANQLAPDEIADDFAILSNGMSELMAVLADYEWDFAAMSMAAMEDPELEARLSALDTPEFDAASENIDAWITANCG